MVDFISLSYTDNYDAINIKLALTSAALVNYVISAVYLEYYKNRTADGSPSNKAVSLDNPYPERDWTSLDTTVSCESIFQKTGLATLEGTMFYVVVELTYVPNPTTKVPREQAVLFDWNAVYEIGMGLVASMVNDCEKGRCDIPFGMEQYVLVYHGLVLALAAQDIDMLEKLWTRFIEFAPAPLAGGCNCSA